MKGMFIADDDSFQSFVEKEFLIGEQAEGRSITEGRFILVLWVHFDLEPETLQTLQGSHERFILQLLRLFPQIERTSALGGRKTRKMLSGMSIKNYRWKVGGIEEAQWSELLTFVAEHCELGQRNRATVSDLLDSYNAFKKQELTATAVGISKRLIRAFPQLSRSTHRVAGLNARCLDGIGLKAHAWQDREEIF